MNLFSLKFDFAQCTPTSTHPAEYKFPCDLDNALIETFGFNFSSRFSCDLKSYTRPGDRPKEMDEEIDKLGIKFPRYTKNTG